MTGASETHASDLSYFVHESDSDSIQYKDLEIYSYSLSGRTKKNGNQHNINTPTTIPNVWAAFFSRLNLAILPARVNLGMDLKE